MPEFQITPKLIDIKNLSNSDYNTIVNILTLGFDNFSVSGKDVLDRLIKKTGILFFGCYVSEDKSEEKLVGALCFNDANVIIELSDFALLPDYRNKNLGFTFYNLSEKILKNVANRTLKENNLVIITSCVSQSLKFYQKIGFQQFSTQLRNNINSLILFKNI